MSVVDAGQLQHFFAEHADGELIPWPAQLELMSKFDLGCHEAELLIMENDRLPARYQRNRRMFSVAQQHKLLSSSAAVVGCGGLGGYIIEEFARLGIGHILAIDPDVFVEHNLNRQLLSTIDLLGAAKVDAAVERIRAVNPAIKASARQVALNRENGFEVLEGMDVVVDAMDNVAGRLELAEVCAELDIPLVHGAIAGWYGQVTTVFPGDDTVHKIYRSANADKGVETQLGNPSFTPAVIASIEATEACKVLLGEGEPLRRRKLAIDLHSMEFTEIPL